MEDFIFSSDEKYPPVIKKGNVTNPTAGYVLTSDVPAQARFVAFNEGTIFISGSPTTAIYEIPVYVNAANQLCVSMNTTGEVYWRLYGY